jgi:hypothetical protein
MEQPLVDDYLQRLDRLMHEGRDLLALVPADGSMNGAALASLRSWQQQCAVAINELSGGSKAHWLARAFSDAFLVRPEAGEAVEDAPVADIVERVLGVLRRAGEGLTRAAGSRSGHSEAAAPPHRFDFVHNLALRPVLEQAYTDARSAFDQGRFGDALMVTCSVLEAIITDALEATGHGAVEWSFSERIAAAEQAGLIRGGCARLPPVARDYRNLTEAGGVWPGGVTIAARDARITSQVLQIVMRDLNPGR